MVEVNIFDAHGKKTGTAAIDDASCERPVNMPLVRQVLLAYQNNDKLGTASTKTRSEVKFSGEKPWRQKGTGRARSGSRGSPIWRSGGVAFGPKPFTRRIKTTAKMKRTALLQSITGKIDAEEVLLFTDMDLDKPSTGKIYDFMKTTGVIGAPILVITGNDTVYKSARNIHRVDVKAGTHVNAFDILKHKYIVAEHSEFEQLLKRAGNER